MPKPVRRIALSVGPITPKPACSLIAADGHAVARGEEITDFRGDAWIVSSWDAPLHSSSSGHVYVRPARSRPGDTVVRDFYPTVFSARIVLDEVKS
jgi:hypothetical protein